VVDEAVVAARHVFQLAAQLDVPQHPVDLALAADLARLGAQHPLDDVVDVAAPALDQPDDQPAVDVLLLGAGQFEGDGIVRVLARLGGAAIALLLAFLIEPCF